MARSDRVSGYGCCPAGTDGLYVYSFEYERKADCLVCSQKPQPFTISADDVSTMRLQFFRCKINDGRTFRPLFFVYISYGIPANALYTQAIRCCLWLMGLF